MRVASLNAGTHPGNAHARSDADRAPEERAQTPREEFANTISHGIGVALALAAWPTLVHAASQRGSAWDVAGAVIFGTTMVILYFTSTLYHATPIGPLKHRLSRIDHASIYWFIAGSYMPFVFGVLRGPWGWTLFAIVWATAAVGSVAKLRDKLTDPRWSIGLYLAMGWVIVLAAVPLVERMSAIGLAWLIGGCVCYTVGAALYSIGARVRFAHFVWHLFVMAGSACHFCAALWHARGTV